MAGWVGDGRIVRGRVSHNIIIKPVQTDVSQKSGSNARHTIIGSSSWPCIAVSHLEINTNENIVFMYVKQMKVLTHLFGNKISKKTGWTMTELFSLLLAKVFFALTTID